jgi:hypothetical protein
MSEHASGRVRSLSLHALLRRYRRGYFRLCAHRSHGLSLPCYRPFRWDGYCGKHADLHLTDDCAREGGHR